MALKKDELSLPLLVATLGVVYGDIGTSPLYALKSTFLMSDLPVTPENVLGVISLFIWILTIVVMGKYINLVLHFDNRGEGGVLALSALCSKLKHTKMRNAVLWMSIAGAGLFFGDGVITPSISILSALEGLNVISPAFSDYPVIGSLIIIVLLFSFQKKGSGVIGRYFGFVMTVWFSVLAVMGVNSIIEEPYILMAFSPSFAVSMIIKSPVLSFFALGGAILVVTGAEALYADMGHFGRRAISVSWTFLVFPALILNYLGQGALLLRNPDALTNPFYLLAPDWGLYPLLILSTIATVIASQAVISGVFSVCWQAIMLGYLPRLEVRHTSYQNIGQVYVPVINKVLFVCTLLAIIGFKSSERLASAYGLSVAGMMLLTTIMVWYLSSTKYHWKSWRGFAIFVPLAIVDSVLVSTNIFKLHEGAWFTLLIAMLVMYVINSWRSGNAILQGRREASELHLKNFIKRYIPLYKERIPGTAIFMTRSPQFVPNSFLIHLKHNKFLHEKILFISIIASHRSRVSYRKRFSYKTIAYNVHCITINIGFKEVPNMDKAIKWSKNNGLLDSDEEISFFLSRGIPVRSEHTRIGRLKERIFVYLAKNSITAYEFYKIPLSKLIELGMRYKL